MKKLLLVAAIMTVFACSKDNVDGPDAKTSKQVTFVADPDFFDAIVVNGTEYAAGTQVITVNEGDELSYEAVPKAGYTFSNWYKEDGSFVTRSAVLEEVGPGLKDTYVANVEVLTVVREAGVSTGGAGNLWSIGTKGGYDRFRVTETSPGSAGGSVTVYIYPFALPNYPPFPMDQYFFAHTGNPQQGFYYGFDGYASNWVGEQSRTLTYPSGQTMRLQFHIQPFPVLVGFRSGTARITAANGQSSTIYWAQSPNYD